MVEAPRRRSPPVTAGPQTQTEISIVGLSGNAGLFFFLLSPPFFFLSLRVPSMPSLFSEERTAGKKVLDADAALVCFHLLNAHLLRYYRLAGKLSASASASLL